MKTQGSKTDNLNLRRGNLKRELAKAKPEKKTPEKRELEKTVFGRQEGEKILYIRIRK